nr:hypothetical protein [Tanacetum cinerariifolium]
INPFNHPFPPQQPQDIPSTSQVAQDLEILKLKIRVKKMERANKVKTVKLRRLRKVGTSQRIKSSDDTLVDDADIYHIDMDHAAKALNMQEDESEVHEEMEVVTTAKLITEVIADVSETVSADAVIPSATKKRSGYQGSRGGIICKNSYSNHLQGQGKRYTGRRMKKKQQVELDEAYARKLQEEFNQDIDWESAIDHVKQRAKEEPFIQRYQVMKKRPQTEAQARRNMMMYLKNTAGFTLNYFKGMSYDDIRLIFVAKFNANMEFILKSKEQIEEEESRAIATINETPAQKAEKRRKLIEKAKEAESIKQHLQIVPDKDDDVFTEATPLARKKIPTHEVYTGTNAKCSKTSSGRRDKDISAARQKLMLLVTVVN